MYKLAVLGPVGTYSHEAAKNYNPGASLVFMNTFQDVLRAVEDGEVNKGILPIENSIHGVVAETLDGINYQNMTIEDEIVLDINHVLVATGPVKENADIKVIFSHRQALGQCREYLKRQYPHALQETTASTSAAMQKIVEEKDEATLAIGNELAATLNGLTIIDKNIQDEPGNQTRFVVFSKKPTLNKKLSFIQIVIIPETDRAGLLFDILSIINKEGVNMLHIESRPNRKQLGSYIFYIKLEIESNDPRYQKIIDKLNKLKLKTKRLTA